MWKPSVANMYCRYVLFRTFQFVLQINLLYTGKKSINLNFSFLPVYISVYCEQNQLLFYVARPSGCFATVYCDVLRGLFCVYGNLHLIIDTWEQFTFDQLFDLFNNYLCNYMLRPMQGHVCSDGNLSLFDLPWSLNTYRNMFILYTWVSKEK
jgi:hypothetical protein